MNPVHTCVLSLAVLPPKVGSSGLVKLTIVVLYLNKRTCLSINTSSASSGTSVGGSSLRSATFPTTGRYRYSLN